MYSTDTYIAADTVNYLQCCFEFSQEWDGYEKTAVFISSEHVYSVVLDGDVCTIPKEVLTGTFGVSVYGTTAGESYKRITTDIVYIDVCDSGYQEGETPEEPTPTVYEQLMQKYSECDSRIDENKAALSEIGKTYRG